MTQVDKDRRKKLCKALLDKEVETASGKTCRITQVMNQEGANGVIFRVLYEGKPCASKFYIPLREVRNPEKAMDRFKNEMGQCLKTSHPYVIEALDSGEAPIGDNSFPFYLMPIAQTSLRKRIPDKFNPYDLEERLRIFFRTMQGVLYLHHNRIIHRDLKPENILMFGNDHPRIADLGIARIEPKSERQDNEDRKTLPNDHLRNRDYYAPEQRKDARLVDHRADIYALGLILYELVTGAYPRDLNLPLMAESDPKLAALDEIQKRMCQIRTEDRYECLDLAIEDMVRALAHLFNPSRANADDLKERLKKCIRSQFASDIQRAIDAAKALGDEGIEIVNDHTGRVDDQNTEIRERRAFHILGGLRSEMSIPRLLEGLYSRDSANGWGTHINDDAAAEAIAGYPWEVILRALQMIEKPVKLEHINVLIRGMQHRRKEVAEVLLHLIRKDLILDKAIGGALLLWHLDPEIGWPVLRDKIRETWNDDMGAEKKLVGIFADIEEERVVFILSKIIPYANREHLEEVIGNLLSDDVALERVMNAILDSQRPPKSKSTQVRNIEAIWRMKAGMTQNDDIALDKAHRRLVQLGVDYKSEGDTQV